MSFRAKEKKHGIHMIFDQTIETEILKTAQDGLLSCAQCFGLSEKLGVSKAAVGQFADHHHIRLVDCRLGLFGHGPGKKKRVQALDPLPGELKTQILNSLDNGKLSCESAWEISRRMKIPKMEVSGACEAMAIRVKTCQIGAF